MQPGKRDCNGQLETDTAGASLRGGLCALDYAAGDYAGDSAFQYASGNNQQMFAGNATTNFTM